MIRCFQRRRRCHTGPCCQWTRPCSLWRCSPRQTSSDPGHAETTLFWWVGPWSRRSSWCPVRTPLRWEATSSHHNRSCSQGWVTNTWRTHILRLWERTINSGPYKTIIESILFSCRHSAGGIQMSWHQTGANFQQCDLDPKKNQSWCFKADCLSREQVVLEWV